MSTEQLRLVRRLVESGSATSVSGFIQHAVGIALDDVSEWTIALTAALKETGGKLTTDGKALADDVLGVVPKRRRTAA